MRAVTAFQSVPKNVNAIVMGIDRRILYRNCDLVCDDINSSYVHFDTDCTRAGILIKGRILNGETGESGEIGRIPISDGTFRDTLLSAHSNKEYVQRVSRSLAALICILNPRYLSVGGDALRQDLFPRSRARSAQRSPPVLFRKSPSYQMHARHSLEGLAYLTSDLIYGRAKLIK